MLDQYGFLYILDSVNDRIQKWALGYNYGTTVLTATMSNPTGMKINSVGNLYISDSSNHRIVTFGLYCRKLTLSKSINYKK